LKQPLMTLCRVGLLALTLALWDGVLRLPMSGTFNLLIIVGGVVLVFPVAWLARTVLDSAPTIARAAWTTTFTHYAVMMLLGVAIIRAVTTHADWSGWGLPIPTQIGLALVVVTGFFTLLTVGTLAVRGLGAPFAIILSSRLAVDWLYARTRNPMVMGTLALLSALGIWFRSALFVLWVLVLVAPALLVFVKVYEERELEIRFGAPYLEYKSRTPMLFPRKPKP
jgi:protein-S-isoprenylcysteine O-methyltransferase Ste14